MGNHEALESDRPYYKKPEISEEASGFYCFRIRPGLRELAFSTMGLQLVKNDCNNNDHTLNDRLPEG